MKRTIWLAVLLLLPGCVGGSSPVEAPRPDVYAPFAAMLFSHRFPNVTVEFDYVEPYRPSKVALQQTEELLRTVAGKAHVELRDPTPIPAQGERLQDDRLHAIDAQYLDVPRPAFYTNQTTVYLHVVYLEGSSYERVTGLYFTTGFIVLFPAAFDSRPALGPLRLPGDGGRETVERRVLSHELGHSFGLVDCGVPMVRPHAQAGDPCHSSNPRSVMRSQYAQPSTQEWLDGVINGPPDAFDSMDIDDVRAFQKTEPGPR